MVYDILVRLDNEFENRQEPSSPNSVISRHSIESRGEASRSSVHSRRPASVQLTQVASAEPKAFSSAKIVTAEPITLSSAGRRAAAFTSIPEGHPLKRVAQGILTYINARGGEDSNNYQTCRSAFAGIFDAKRYRKDYKVGAAKQLFNSVIACATDNESDSSNYRVMLHEVASIKKALPAATNGSLGKLYDEAQVCGRSQVSEVAAGAEHITGVGMASR